MRLSDLFTRDATGRLGLTWRELGALIRQLPPTARTRMVLGEDHGLWGLAEHLQAMTLDELRIANWQRANEGREKTQQTKRPLPVPRPGTTKQKRSRKDSPERIAAHKSALERAAARRTAIAAGQIT